MSIFLQIYQPFSTIALFYLFAVYKKQSFKFKKVENQQKISEHLQRITALYGQKHAHSKCTFDIIDSKIRFLYASLCRDPAP